MFIALRAMWLTVISRVELQRIFFPPVYRDLSPSHPLRPGDARVWPALKVFVELRDMTTLQIPFREASKANYALPHLHTDVLIPPVGLAVGRSSRV